MTLLEIATKEVVQFHNALNPVLFAGSRLKPQVRKKLLSIANDFIESLNIHSLDIEDIIITGSNAGYNYTKHSDIDLHILIDGSKLAPEIVYDELFDAKKTIYNKRYDIKIGGYDVELYIQDSNEPHISGAEWSVLNDRWNKRPIKKKPEVNRREIKAKYLKLKSIIDDAIESNDRETITAVQKKLKKYRQSGLESGGEWSTENLAWKMCRSSGLLGQLLAARDKIHGARLSLSD